MVKTLVYELEVTGSKRILCNFFKKMSVHGLPDIKHLSGE